MCSEMVVLQYECTCESRGRAWFEKTCDSPQNHREISLVEIVEEGFGKHGNDLFAGFLVDEIGQSTPEAQERADHLPVRRTNPIGEILVVEYAEERGRSSQESGLSLGSR
eukprot:c10376_g1_i1.p2 GENE.c10376_g1_i1~~c10376_g1_i1.p2  ORF type:complete len:110 (-),score=15.48 c10376_g1_i1:78-407(-)